MLSLSRYRPSRTAISAVLPWLLGIALCGCQPLAEDSPIDRDQNSAEPRSSHGNTAPSPLNPADSAVERFELGSEPGPRFPWESWYAYSINEEPVGFSHLTAAAITVGNEPHVRYRMEDQITLRRGSTNLTQRIEQESLEQWNGRPVRLEATVQVGSDITRFRGHMQDEKLRLETIRGEQTTIREIPWQSDFFGPFAVQQSLRDQPLQAGDQRTIHSLMPVQNSMGRNELRALSGQPVVLSDGESHDLLQVESRILVGGNEILTSYRWLDRWGRTFKLSVPSLNLIGMRTSRAQATAPVSPQRDVLATTFVPLARPLPGSRTLREAIYQITLADKASRKTLSFPNIPGQSVSPQSDDSIQIQVTSGVAHQPPAGWAEPTADDLKSGPLVDFEAAAVMRLSAEAVPDQRSDSRATALQLTQFVSEYVANKDFSRAFASASRVADEATGDCTEHAVLLAALLRQQGIPARVAAGLVYLETADGPVMAYHMWNLAFVDDGWLALDATLGGGEAPADRIAMLTSDLASGNEYECLLPVLSVLGQFKVKIISP